MEHVGQSCNVPGKGHDIPLLYNVLSYYLQHGFCSKRSCETHLVEFVDGATINKSNDKQTFLLWIFQKPLTK